MKTLVILGIVLGLLAVVGIATAQIGNEEVSSDANPETCSPGQGCPTGGCSAGNNCGLSACEARTGSSCGCGGR